MARKEYTNHVLRTYVDPETGEIIKQDEFVEVSKGKKLKGFRLTYMNNLIALASRFNNTSEFVIGAHILCDMPTKMSYEIKLDVKSLALQYRVKPWVIKRVIKSLKNCQAIVGSRGEYLVNPFLVVPRYMPDDLVLFAQQQWKLNFGEYKLTTRTRKKRELHITPEEAAGRSMNSPV